MEPDKQKVLVTLLLAFTDRFEDSAGAVQHARDLLGRLHDEYECACDAGLCEAMAFYEQAGSLCPPGNDDALRRWNACARVLMEQPSLRPAPEEELEHPLE